MALNKGRKPAFTEELLQEAWNRFQVRGQNNVPLFVRAYENKERFLANKLMAYARNLSRHHKQRLEEEVGKPLPEAVTGNMNVDFYVMCWFGYMCSEMAKDADFEKTMEAMMEDLADAP